MQPVESQLKQTTFRSSLFSLSIRFWFLVLNGLDRVELPVIARSETTKQSNIDRHAQQFARDDIILNRIQSIRTFDHAKTQPSISLKLIFLKQLVKEPFDFAQGKLIKSKVIGYKL